MSLKMVRGKNLPIGVDLGSRMLKLAQLRQVEDQMELLAADCLELPASVRASPRERLSFQGDAIRRMLGSGIFKGRQAIIALPAEATFVHHVRIPKVAEDQVRGAIQEELHGKLPYPVENAVVRTVLAGDVCGEGEPRQDVVVVAAAKQTLEQYLGMARRARLDVVGVNIESCAVVECFSRLFRRATDMARTTLFVDIGSASTQVVLATGTRLAFVRNLVIGGDRLDQELAEGLKISPDEARIRRMELAADQADPQQVSQASSLMEKALDTMVEQLTQCLRYYESVFHNQSIERAIFVGGQAYDKRLCQTLARRLNLPAQVGDPLVRIQRSAGCESGVRLDCRQPQPGWAVAVGLSIGATVAA